MVFRQVVEIPSQDVLYWMVLWAPVEVSLPMAELLELDDLWSFFQPKPTYDSINYSFVVVVAHNTYPTSAINPI